MRVLYVSYGFPPRGQWGTEYYTHQLALGARERGHDVAVFHPVRDGQRPRYTLERETSEGFPVYLVHNAGDPRKRFADSYSNAGVEEVFERVLEEWRPDLVHFTYLIWGLSVRLPLACRARGIPTVVTLTDFGLVCHRGQMVDHRLRQCHGPHPAATCARCVREPSRYDAEPWRVFAKRWAARALAAVGGAGLVVTPRDVELREAAVRETLAAVDRLVAPTRVVEDVFLGLGVPRERLLHAPYGLREEPFAAARARPDGGAGGGPAGRSGPRIVRFGFLGQLMPHKGAHTLLEAVRILEHRLPESVEPWEVWIYGEGTRGRHRRYAEQLLAGDHGPRVYTCQPFAPFQIVRILSQLDAVVMPSEWDENAPLTALQARAAGVPVLASDVRGITEVIEDGVHGRIFPVGDSARLADAMRDVILGRLGRSAHAGVPVGYAEHLDLIDGLYAELSGAAPPAPTRELEASGA